MNNTITLKNYKDYIKDDTDYRYIALAIHLNHPFEEIENYEISKYDDNIIIAERNEFLIIHEDELDEMILKSYKDIIDYSGVDNLFKNGINYEIEDGYIKVYIEEEITSELRGSLLGFYDGEEDIIKLDGEEYYIYRIK